MSQLTDNLSAIASIKSDIKSAIEAKGVSMSGISFGSYADKIGEIQTGGTFVTETLSVSNNGTYTPSQGVDGFSQVVVNVQGQVDLAIIPTGSYSKYSILSNSASFVGSLACRMWSYLQVVNLPDCEIVNQQGFEGCTYLTEVNLPICSAIGTSAFHNCSNLTSVSLPECQILNPSAFEYCTSLSSIDLPKLNGLNAYAFYNCTNLSVVIIRASSRCGCETNTFTRTPIAAGTGSIFVPASLVEVYKSAYAWSAFSSQIFPIPE